jgi:hypothetical protein
MVDHERRSEVVHAVDICRSMGEPQKGEPLAALHDVGLKRFAKCPCVRLVGVLRLGSAARRCRSHGRSWRTRALLA